jgi:hypothetical protein
MTGPKPNENMRKESPIGPAGMVVPRIVIKRNPVRKKRKTEVSITPPKIKKKAVNLLALIAFDSMN